MKGLTHHIDALTFSINRNLTPKGLIYIYGTLIKEVLLMAKIKVKFIVNSARTEQIVDAYNTIKAKEEIEKIYKGQKIIILGYEWMK